MSLSTSPHRPDPDHATLDHRRRHRLVRRLAPLVALLPLVAAVLAIVLVGGGERSSSPTDTLPAGSGSAEAAALMDRLPATDDAAVVVIEASSGRLDANDLRRARALAAAVGVTPTPDGGLTVADDGSVAIASVPLGGTTETDRIAAVEQLRDDLEQRTPDGITSAVTGPDAVDADLDAVFDGADTTLLAATAGVVALLLIVTYRSPILFVVPLVVVGVADQLASVVATRLMGWLDVAYSDATTAILSILVFGAGTDYALLLISRYRSELATHVSRHAAMAVALRRTAEAVLTSAATVVVGVLCLLLSLTPSTRALGVASAVGIVVAAGFVLVVLPAALVCFGRWIFWPRVPRVASPVDDGPDAAVERSLWFRVGVRVSRRPRAVVAGALAVVALASTGLLGLDLGLDTADGFKDTPESVAAAQRLAQSFPAGLSDPVQVVTRADADTALTAVRGVDGVTSADVTARGDGVSLIEAVLGSEPGSDAARSDVEDLRAAVDDLPETHVAGTEALAMDTRDGTLRDLLLIVPAVTLVVLLTLALTLRSVVAPLVLVGTVVATYVAALGASWWLFTSVLGYDGVEVNVPVIGFVFLVALGVDYTIFLVTRAREEAAIRGPRAGMLHALGATGGVITSAGILLAAVFTVLGLLPAVGLAQIGALICIGVLLDTLLIRTVLVPAIALVLGDRFWWPRTTIPRHLLPPSTTPEGALHD